MDRDVMREAGPQYRLASVEYLRGIAAFAVAFGHLSWPLVDQNGLAFLFNHDFASAVFAAPSAMPMFHQYTPQSLLWVDCFFLISGFVIEMSLAKNSARGFLIQRAFRIYPMFWIACAGQLLAVAIIGGAAPSLRQVLNEALLLDGYSLTHVGWTLLAEMRFYLISALFLVFGFSWAKRTIAVNALFVFCFISDALGVRWADSFIWDTVRSTAFWLAWMHTGSLAYSVWVNWKSGRDVTPAFRLTMMHLFIFTVGCTILGHDPNSPIYSNTQSPAFLGALLIFGLILIGEPYMPRVPLLSWLGRISYPLYVLHLPVGWLTFYLTYRHVGRELGFVAAMISALAVANVAHFVIEGPTNRLGKRLSRGWRRSPDVVCAPA